MNTIRGATYIGLLDKLHGEHALVMRAGAGRMKAQFDKTETGYAFGWHEFAAHEFRMDPCDHDLVINEICQKCGAVSRD